MTFISLDGVHLEGTLEVPEAARSCVLLCHGITVDREEAGVFSELARRLAEAGLASFRFDFRGHGKSGGRFEDMTVVGEIEDARASLRLISGLGFSGLALVGASFGGGVVSYLAAERPLNLKALVLWNAVLEYSIEIFDRRQREGLEIGGKLFRFSPRLFAGLPAPTPGGRLVGSGFPAVFIHGDRDEAVPYALSVKYSKLMPGASLVTLPGAGHGFHDAGNCAKACSAAVEFLSRHL